jgi:tRNA-dihydrouridine synthase B
MLSSRPELRESLKTRLLMDHAGESGPISVQIAGSDPAQLADAARFNVGHGAEIIDINMGCPAKKVCNVAAGSALLADEARVARILEAVVAAVDVPVTLKIRTGPSRSGATPSASPASPRRRASRCSPFMAAPAPACSRDRPSTTPSPR